MNRTHILHFGAAAIFFLFICCLFVFIDVETISAQKVEDNFTDDGQILSDHRINDDQAFVVITDAPYFFVGGYGGTQIEKREQYTGALVTEFSGDGKVAAASSVVRDMLVSDSYLYTVGNGSGAGADVYIEKRDKTTGALVSGFGSGGVVQRDFAGSHDYYTGIAADDTHLYLTGYYTSLNGSQYEQNWFYEKRDKTTGALDSSFGSGGTVTSAPSIYDDQASDILIDTSYIYAVGYYVTNNCVGGCDTAWRIEKRDKTTGALVSGFGSGGVYTWNGVGNDKLTSIATDGTSLFVAGQCGRCSSGSDSAWRIGKLNKTNGAFVTAFGSNGILVSDPSTSIYNEGASAIIVEGTSLFITGNCSSCSGSVWRIAKHDSTTGALVTDFDGDGIALNGSSLSGEWPYSIASDGSYVYTVGDCNNCGDQGGESWFLECRAVDSGELCHLAAAPPVTLDLLVENLTAPGSLEGGQSAVFGIDVRNQGNGTAGTLAWSQTGNTLSLVDDYTIVTSLTTLNDTDAVYTDVKNDQLRTFRFDGSDWNEIGTPYDIGGSFMISAVAALNSTDIALYDSGSDYLRTYRFNGSTWSPIGSAVDLNAPNADITALNSTDVAFIDHGSDNLRTYRFNGSIWSQLGNALYLGSASCPKLAALDDETVALFASDSDSLTAYSFDGTNWSQTGNAYSLGGSTGCLSGGVTALNTTDVAYIRSDGSIRTLRFDGTDWTQVGTTSASGATGSFAMEALDESNVALFDTGNDSIRTVSFESGPFASRFCINSTEAECANGTAATIIGEPDTGPLDAGIAESATSSAWTATAGSHTLYVCTDANNDVIETDETNNCTSLGFSVAGTPDLITENLGYSGTLEEGQSISFSGDVRNQGDGATAFWEVGNASYSGISAFITSGARGFYIKSDGTKMYLTNNSTSIYQYTFSTPWDITTLSLESSLDPDGVGTFILDISFNDDGTKMYLTETGTDTIHQYTLSTAWDISTATDSGLFLDTGYNGPGGPSFKYDGTEMYVSAGVGDELITQYTLSTPWDVSSATFTSVKDISVETSNPNDVMFSSDGTRMFVNDIGWRRIFQYSLTTPWDLSTASYDSLYADIDPGAVAPGWSHFKSDGSKFYAIANGSGILYEFDLGASRARFCLNDTESDCENGSSAVIIDELDVGSLSANSTELLTSSSWTATVGDHTLYVCADVNTDVTESDETNNCTSLDFSITALAQCNDGADNDGDGLFDFPDDPGCDDAADDDETDDVVFCPGQSLEASPVIIRAGEDATLEWVNPVDVATCELSGGELSTSPETSVGNCNVNSTVVSPGNITTYTMSCDYDPLGNNVPWATTTTVYVTPSYDNN